MYLAFTPVVLISVFFRLSSDRTKLKYIDFEHCKLKFILWKATCQSQDYLFEYPSKKIIEANIGAEAQYVSVKATGCRFDSRSRFDFLLQFFSKKVQNKFHR